MTKIRRLTAEHFEDVFQLNLYAFRFNETDDVRERMRHEFDYGLAYGAFSEESLTSSLIVFPFDVYYHDRILKMGGIGNVTSYPEVRGQGSVRQLMVKALKEMKDQGIVLSYLDPFSYRFYRKFGYEVAFETRQYEIKSSDFGPFEVPESRVARVTWEEEKEAVKSIYHQKMKKAKGPLKRNDWVWEKRLRSFDKTKLALFKDDKGIPQGYLFYKFAGDNQNTFQIDELTALTGMAEKALWEFIGTHASSFDTFTCTCRTDQRLTHLFNEARLNQKLTASMMARIVDMAAFLKQVPFKKTTAQEFWLEVTDDSAAWNNQTFRLSLSDNQVNVSVAEAAGDPARHLKANIQTWTQLFMSFKKAEDLLFEGSLSASKETAQALQNSLPEGVPELHDYF